MLFALTLGGGHDVGDLACVQLGGRECHGPGTVHDHRLEVVRLVKSAVAVRVRADDHLMARMTLVIL